MKITHRIALNINNASGGGYPWVASRYNGTVTCYIEGQVKATSGTFTASLQADGTTKDSISTTNTNYETKRGSGWTQSADAIITITTSGSGAGMSIQLVVVQDVGSNNLTATSHSWSYPSPNGRYTSSTTPVEPYEWRWWKYTSADYDGTVSCRFECEYYSYVTKYGVTILVQEDDGSLGNWTTKATLVSGGTAASWTRVNASFTPTDGRTYRIVYYVSNSKGTAYIYRQVPIIIQTGSPITKTVAVAHSFEYGTTYWGYNLWDTYNDFMQCTRDSKIRACCQTYSASQYAKFQYLAGSTWTDITNCSVQVTAQGWFDESTAATMPDGPTEIRGSFTSNYSMQSHLVHRLVRTTYTIRAFAGSGYVRAQGSGPKSKTFGSKLTWGGAYLSGQGCYWTGNPKNASIWGMLWDWGGGIDPRLGASTKEYNGSGYVKATGALVRQTTKYGKTSGGVYGAGSGPRLKIKMPPASGYVKATGAAVSLHTRTKTTSGGFYAAGQAIVQVNAAKIWNATGGFYLGGSATVQKVKIGGVSGAFWSVGAAIPPKTKIVTAAGGVYSVGSAQRQHSHSPRGAGWAILAGAGVKVGTKDFDASGGFYAGGFANVIPFAVRGSGGMYWAGECEFLHTRNWFPVGSGGVWVTGSAEYDRFTTWIPVITGGVTVGGSADVRRNFYHGKGGVYLKGAAIARGDIIANPPGQTGGEAKYLKIHNRTWMFLKGEWIPKKPKSM